MWSLGERKRQKATRAHWTDPELGVAPDDVIAERHGVRIEAVRTTRRTLGLPSEEDGGGPGALDAAIRARNADGREDQEIARELRVPTHIVTPRRKALGLDRPHDAVSADLAGAIADALTGAPGSTPGQVARMVGAPTQRVRAQLVGLERLGVVYRAGGSGKRWFVG